MNNERIILMGTPMLSRTVLQRLIDEKLNIVAVVTQPDALVGRKKILVPSPVKELANAYGITCFTPEKIRKDYQMIVDLKPDLIITAAYGQIIPQAIIDLPKYGCINTHASLLPKYRGGAPIQRSIINGDTFTGMTLMYMNAKMDEGDILFREKLEISEEDTNSTIFEKMSYLASDMLIKHLDDIIGGHIKPIKQNHEEATYSYNLNKNDEFISFRDSARLTSCHIRGLLDNPGAFAILDNESYKLKDVSYDLIKRGEAGEFIGLIDKKLAIGTSDGTVFIASIQPAGKKFIDAASFYNGKGRNLKGKIFNAERV